jgi:hypothetical protein
MLMTTPPKLVYNDSGQLVEVILTADDFRAYLRTLADEKDWESLPVHLQDAIDQLLINDVRLERDEAVSLEDVLAKG